MGASLWVQVWLPLLIGVAIQIIVSALCFLSARLWKCLMKQRKTQTAGSICLPSSSAGDGAQDHTLSEVGATAHANAVTDLEMENSFGSPEGGESVAQPDLEMATENSGERSKTQVTKSATRGAIVPAEGDVPQQSEADEAPVTKVVDAGHAVPVFSLLSMT